MKQMNYPRRRRHEAALALLLSPMLALSPSLGAAQPVEPLPGAQSPALRSNAQVTLNFVNADIDAVTRALSAMLDRQIVVDPRVRGQMTLYSERPLSVREAYQNYLAALRGLGFAMVETGGILKLVPEAEAKLQAGTVTVGAASSRPDQVVTQIFRLNHENPNNLVAVLRPLISANNTINANPSNSTLVITDYADNLQRIGKIIAALDQPSSTDIEVVAIRHAVASDLAAMVQRLADGGSGGAMPGAPGMPAMPGGGGAVSVLADPRSNSLILRASNPARLAQVRSIIAKLDQPGGGVNGNIWVVYLKNADATKLATVLRAAFTPSGGAGGASGAGLTPSTPQPQNPLSQQGSSSSSAGGISSAATAPLQQSQGPSTGGFIQADPSTNSLIITAPEPLYRQIRAAIDQLDARRAQVFVESMIVKIDANKSGQFGIQWQHLFGKSGDSTLAGGGTNFGLGNSNILNLSAAVAQGRTGAAAALASGGFPGGLNIGVLRQIGGFYTLGAIANFLETNTGANVLSTPNLVSLDNEEAKIVIGQNVPFVTGSFTNTGTGTGSVNPFQTIERKDVGLTLRIKSQIGEGGTIRMTIFQENSSVVPGATTTAGPTTDKSSIETTVVVDDGQIMVLGGLLKDEYSDGEDRVPGLGSIPLVGNLFRNESRKRIKTNLMVFLRPVVIRDQPTADSLTIDRYESIRALQQGGQPRPSVVIPINESPVLPPLLPTNPPAPVPPPLGETAPLPPRNDQPPPRALPPPLESTRPPTPAPAPQPQPLRPQPDTGP